MDLDSGQLRAFVTLAEELHFGRAADRLHVSQQALSKRIRRLESVLGTRLLERRPVVTLSTAGAAFLEPARTAVDAVDAATATVRVAERALRADVLDQHLWPGLVTRKALESGMRLDTVSLRADRDTLDVLRSGDADVAFGRAGALPTPWPPDLRRRLVGLEPIALLVDAGDQWADHPHVTAADLRQRTCWFPMVGAPQEWRTFLDEFADEHDIEIEYGGATMGFDYWLSRVGRGQVPPTFIGTAMELPPIPGIRTVAIADPTPAYPWWALWRRRLPTHLVDELLSHTGGPSPSTGLAASDPGIWLPRRDRAYITHDSRN